MHFIRGSLSWHAFSKGELLLYLDVCIANKGENLSQGGKFCEKWENLGRSCMSAHFHGELALVVHFRGSFAHRKCFELFFCSFGFLMSSDLVLCF